MSNQVLPGPPNWHFDGGYEYNQMCAGGTMAHLVGLQGPEESTHLGVPLPIINSRVEKCLDSFGSGCQAGFTH